MANPEERTNHFGESGRSYYYVSWVEVQDTIFTFPKLGAEQSPVLSNVIN